MLAHSEPTSRPVSDRREHGKRWGRGRGQRAQKQRPAAAATRTAGEAGGEGEERRATHPIQRATTGGADSPAAERWFGDASGWCGEKAFSSAMLQRRILCRLESRQAAG
jgi:hypothetical protein